MKATANYRINAITLAFALVFAAGSVAAATSSSRHTEPAPRTDTPADLLISWNHDERIAPRSILPEGQRDDIAPRGQPGTVMVGWNDDERIAPRSILPEGQRDDIAPRGQPGTILISCDHDKRIAPRGVLPEGQHRGIVA
ncbi:MAG: hypothetical protein HYS20_01705 [Rhodocyclales bacterium]|nr:hypothetical protein [Rhodocyclales bacterium]